MAGDDRPAGRHERETRNKETRARNSSALGNHQPITAISLYIDPSNRERERNNPHYSETSLESGISSPPLDPPLLGFNNEVTRGASLFLFLTYALQPTGYLVSTNQRPDYSKGHVKESELVDSKPINSRDSVFKHTCIRTRFHISLVKKDAGFLANTVGLVKEKATGRDRVFYRSNIPRPAQHPSIKIGSPK